MMLLELLGCSSSFLRYIHQDFSPIAHLPGCFDVCSLEKFTSFFFGNNCVKNIILGRGNKTVRHNSAFRELIVLIGNIHTHTVCIYMHIRSEENAGKFMVKLRFKLCYQ